MSDLIDIALRNLSGFNIESLWLITNISNFHCLKLNNSNHAELNLHCVNVDIDGANVRHKITVL